jgi:hypothetical protein
MMKKIAYKMGRLFLTVGLCLISFNSNAQDIKLTRQEQKEARRSVMVANYQVLDSLLASKNFVLKADFLEDKYGERIVVVPVLNFIRVDSLNAVLQTGFGTSLGYNGVGGVTAEGRINNWEIVRNNKNLSFYLQFNILTSIGYYDVSMMISADNFVQATITGLTRGMLIYDGHLETNINSGVYKGQSP